ncbi:Uncharacterized protein TSPI_04277 [Trichinella spiralis]|uniref:Uncharacterized protein n=2 Tax=Trichinella spiralis TaxID=6334 RepID=A0ABR3KE58_TRISP
MWCGMEVDDLQSLKFSEILDLIGELAYSVPDDFLKQPNHQDLKPDSSIASLFQGSSAKAGDLVPDDFLKQPNHQDLKPQVDHKQSLDWSIQRI